ncbi:MAG TPA: hypothetical protein VGH19_01590 [Verrucomicrobiae bacterium]
MAWLIHNWFWLLLAVILVGFSIAATRHAETRRYRVRLIASLLLMEFWVCLVARATSLTVLLPLGILGFVLMRLCMPALSHIMAQAMADKATDAMFGEREPAPPVLERRTVNHLRKKYRPEEAIVHLLEVLDKNPDDFESRFLLASIYVEDMRDLPSAEREIQFIQKSRAISPSLQALAVQWLKIWQEAFHAGAMELEGLRSPGAPKPVVVETPPVETVSIPVEELPVPKPAPVASHEAVNELCGAGNYGSAMRMIDGMLGEKPDDLAGWAIKARIHVQYLAQPAQADNALRHVLDAADILPEHVEAVNKLAEAFARSKDHYMKAGRLWRKLNEAPSIPVEEKEVILSRLKTWEAAVH